MNKQIKATILSAIVALGSATGLWANSDLLTPNTSVTGIAQYTNSVAPTIAGPTSPTFTSVGENGYVYEYILANFADNPWSGAGGLTFVYQIFNNTSSADAIRGLSIGGWAGAQTAVAIDYSSGVVAKDAYRSFNGDVVGFDFAVPNQILPGSNSGWLLIYSDATSYQNVNAGILDGAGANVTLFSANLPDGGTTAMMLGLGLLGLGLAARRNKRA